MASPFPAWGNASARCASDLLQRLNSESISAATCFREISISVGGLGDAESRPGRKLLVRTVYRRQDEVTQMAFCACSPFFLQGIAFLLVQKKGRVDPFEMHIFLPYGKRQVITVGSERRGEGLLGSDFSYDDLKLWHYEDCWGSLRCGNPRGEKENHLESLDLVWKADLKPRTVQWHKQRLYVQVPEIVLKQIEFFTEADERPFRILHLTGHNKVDGITLPDRMCMQNYQTNSETVIRLERAWADRAVDHSLFEPRSLPELFQQLQSL